MTGAEEVALDNFRNITRYYEAFPAGWNSIVHSASLGEKWKIFSRDVKRGRIQITPEFMRSIENDELKQRVIEAICLAKA